MAYLARHNIVDAVLTEDSDLVVFGCKHILYKAQGSGYVKKKKMMMMVMMVISEVSVNSNYLCFK